jgi:eight-cysteine-cluster-containing protein
MNNKKLVVATVIGIIIVTVVAAIGALLLYLYVSGNQKLAAIDSFEDCAAAGYPIMESYPEQCATPDGRVFVRQLSEEEKDNLLPPGEGTGTGSGSESSAYYGSSTKASCSTNSDCATGGCNQEVCGSKDEVDRLVTICIAPDKPTPDKAGYTCGCVAKQCAWKR